MRKDNVLKNDELRFYLYLKQYKLYFIGEDFTKAIDALKSALKIKPNDIMVKIWLSESYDRIGNSEKAIGYYYAVYNSGQISGKLRDYTMSQIERIKNEGSKKVPMGGYRYMTF